MISKFPVLHTRWTGLMLSTWKKNCAWFTNKCPEMKIIGGNDWLIIKLSLNLKNGKSPDNYHSLWGHIPARYYLAKYQNWVKQAWHYSTVSSPFSLLKKLSQQYFHFNLLVHCTLIVLLAHNKNSNQIVSKNNPNFCQEQLAKPKSKPKLVLAMSFWFILDLHLITKCWKLICLSK